MTLAADPYAGLDFPDPTDPDAPSIVADSPARPDLLVMESIQEVLARVRSKPPRRYLVRRIWAEGSYGVLSAQDKAGKTWADLDLAVSASSGTPWMNTWPVDVSGPVVLFLGEGGEDKAVRRLEAICRSRGLVLDDLPLYLCFRTPRMTDVAHLAQVGDFIANVQPVLVIVDPLYLAAGGADGKDLFAMGDVLGRLQHLCEPKGVALFVTHHWNKGGVGTGHHRSTGVGPGAWGRTNISMSAEDAAAERGTHGTTVDLTLEFQGDEVAEPDTTIRRHVWADDDNDLNSPLHYEITPLTASAAETDKRAAILAIVQANDGITFGNLRKQAGGNTVTTGALIDALVQAGDLRQTSGSRGARYLHTPPSVPLPGTEGNQS